MEIPLNEVIYTDNCLLRFVSEQDIQYVWSACRYEGFNAGMIWDPPECMDDLLLEYQKNLQSWQEGSAYNWAIENDVSGDFLGRIEIRKNITANEWTLGFWIHPLHQRNGYATESAKAVLGFGFSRLKAQTIVADHAVWNTPSKIVLERIGMSFVDQNPCGFEKHGACVSTAEYEITQQQWLSLGNKNS